MGKGLPVEAGWAGLLVQAKEDAWRHSPSGYQSLRCQTWNGGSPLPPGAASHAVPVEHPYW